MADSSEESRELEGSVAESVLTEVRKKLEHSGEGLSWWKSALIGVAGAVLGGVGTGIATYYTTVRQIDSTAHESRIEFYRAQKEAAFTQLMTDSADAFHPVEDYAFQFANFSNDNPVDMPKLRADVAAKVGKVWADYYAIQILRGDSVDLSHVGVVDCVEAAKAVSSRLDEQFKVTDHLYERWEHGDLDDSVRRASYQPNSREQRAVSEAQASFSDIANAELTKI